MSKTPIEEAARITNPTDRPTPKPHDRVENEDGPAQTDGLVRGGREPGSGPKNSKLIDEVRQMAAKREARKPKQRVKKRQRNNPIIEVEDDDDDDGRMMFMSLAEVKDIAGDVEWPWDPWILKGFLTMFVGDQDVGKSYLMTYLIAVFTGALKEWPNGDLYEGKTGPVLLVETESMSVAYEERLSRLGVDTTKDVGIVTYGFDSKEEQAAYIPQLTQDLDDIEELAEDMGPSAVIIDSLSAGHELKENDAQQMLTLFKKLSRFAKKLRIPVLIVHHLRKGLVGEGPHQICLADVRGSTTNTQLCRSIVALSKVSYNDDDPKKVHQIKRSFSRAGEPFGFTIDDDGMHFEDAPTLMPVLNKAQKASQFLREFLKDGPRPFAEILREAGGRGITKSALTRAKYEMKIQPERQKDRSTVWSLPTFE